MQRLHAFDFSSTALGGTDPVVGYEGLPNALKLGVFPKTKVHSRAAQG